MIIARHVIIPGFLVLTVGCKVDSDRAAVSDTSTATTNPPPAASTTPTGTPTVSERGIGRLQAGMSVDEATTALNGAFVLPAGADASACSYAQWRGGPTGVRVMVEAGRLARVDVDSLGVATAAGAQVGDSEERVLSLYSGRTRVIPHKYERGHYVTVLDQADSTFALVFETVDGRVKRYRAGKRPQVEYVEGCG